MGDEDDRQFGHPLDGGYDSEDSVEGTEITVYEWRYYKRSTVVKDGRCINAETDGNTVKVVNVSGVERSSAKAVASGYTIDTYYSEIFTVGGSCSFEMEPKYRMTVHPDEVEGEFLNL